ncbi:hypothetical protein FT663_01515 [Candidozyma haemuli var. vulneris]|uniref:Vacuolar protein 14 C-terminal Fig4-binding domain-containing protein n=1 Tax=Candidozyma haemuli TaxID=45357 RepID=A0A2V1ASV5_9ASCO|nr:hypothetical protein CXQ85_000135 [[Candida] haemuloni]KAF3988921.1 hypothetical protein FT662_03154 [[Candida] haemuloni var. vulneris]KAF3994395.1 hypothetical protein FT663_01515 [[Candida] haemuloni var. vulneris]PVH21170.1 hypothetical protein CXQ85_000135 [[Candida] haemuloni]
MAEPRVLEPAIIKDLSNHIYERRKATAFQIEGFTKQALARNDSPTISKIIAELTELLDGVSTSATMGAITALGSVSVALGSFAIAYFLDDIVRPIFRTFKDTDARVRYYACESLYNISKIARGEILLYFNELFDILCILVTDTESSVKNAADILDRLIKDIVSAKSTNYVSILQQKPEETTDIESNVPGPDGLRIQVNNPQDASKAFSLPKFIPTLLERMYTIDPFAKKFLLSWLELFDDIPSLELLTFLPNFLEPLVRFLMNNCPSDVRVETHNLLNIFLKEIRSIYKVKYDLKKKQLAADVTEKQKSQQNKEQEVEENMNGLNIENEQSATADDTASIKSSSTTVIRRPAKKNDGEREGGTGENDISQGDDSLFIDGQDIFIDCPRIIDILLSFLRSTKTNISQDVKLNDLSGESHEIYLEIQSTVLKWLQELVSITPTSFSKFLPDCIAINMHNIALADDNKDYELRSQFLKFNQSLQSYLVRLNQSASDANVEHAAESKTSPTELNISENDIEGLNKDVLEEFTELYLNKSLRMVMNECLHNVNELARLTSLDWLTFLYSSYPESFFELGENEENHDKTDRYLFDLTALLRSSTDSSNDVISKVLSLASKISEDNQEFFKEFMVKLISFFENDGVENTGRIGQSDESPSGQNTISRDKVEFIIRRLCVSISAEKIFQTLSEVLVSLEGLNLEFIGNIVVTLNNILLTAHELSGLRQKLKNLDFQRNEDWTFFSALFQSWCHSPASALSICLLTSNHELAFLIIKCLGESEVTFQLLTQLDILIQLLETPIFLKLRLQLLEPDKHPHLYKTLYGILMIMPQSSTFTTLKNRLSTVAPFHGQNSPAGLSLNTPSSTPGAIPTSNSAQLSARRKKIHELADKFSKVNDIHQANRSRRRLQDYVKVEDPVREHSKHQPEPSIASTDQKGIGSYSGKDNKQRTYKR